LVVLSALRVVAGVEVNLWDWVGLLLSLGILTFLVMALLYPEKFK
jgi:K+-transporting ATPase KdpF subunit